MPGLQALQNISPRISGSQDDQMHWSSPASLVK